MRDICHGPAISQTRNRSFDQWDEDHRRKVVSRASAEQLLGKEKMKYVGPKSSSISRGEMMSSDLSDTHWSVRRWIVRMDLGEGS